MKAVIACVVSVALSAGVFGKCAEFEMSGYNARISLTSPEFSAGLIVHGDGWMYTGTTLVRGGNYFSPPSPAGTVHLLDVALTNGAVRRLEGAAYAVSLPDGGTSVSYQAVPLSSGRVATISVQGSLKADGFHGGRIVADGKEMQMPGATPKASRSVDLSADRLRMESPDGSKFLDFRFASKQRMCIMGSSKSESYTLRFLAATGNVESGKTYRVAFTLHGSDKIIAVNEPWTTEAGERFVPLAYSADIKEGSALDFSGIVPRDPCGTHGRLRVKGAHFEFERLPGVRQRFYGINLHSHACTNTMEEARLLVGRFVKMGYNAVRFHNFENSWMGLTCGSPDEATPVAERFVGIDNLVAALRERGMYLTVDMHVGRTVSYRALGIDKPGLAPGGELKYLYLTNKAARDNFKRLVKGFLNHVNPHTGNRYADEPTLALFSFVNEGPGSWKYAKPGDNICALEEDFMRDMRDFVRNEVKSDLPLTNWNGCPTYFCIEKPRAGLCDYVDDHPYFDHPGYPEDAKWRRNTRLPVYTANRRIFGERERYRPEVWTRIWGKPYVITEFNWCAPSLYRSWVGVVFGSAAALQDWDGLWRYLWCHDHTRSLNPGKYPIFNLEGASDPLAQAAERAAMCLFLRGDMKPLTKSAAIVIDDASLNIRDPKHKSLWMREAKNVWAMWYAKLGTTVGTPPDGLTAKFRYPNVNPSDAAVEKSLGIDSDTPLGDGRVSIEYGRNAFSVNTPMTCGVAVESGRMVGGILDVDAGDEITALWASSLDGKDLRSSGRILLTHLTRLYNTGDRFADFHGKFLLDIGNPPYLMPRATAKVTLAVDSPKAVTVYALDTDGTRRFKVPTSVVDGRLSFACATDKDEKQATYLYELVR